MAVVWETDENGNLTRTVVPDTESEEELDENWDETDEEWESEVNDNEKD